ncbi:hypothetical protein BJY00DRAFT_285132 [Aspergillus carlsbadensis]|nr:hypothetical protein BJY00DRAFT_285132 [Aspergillus carlsbadensis]
MLPFFSATRFTPVGDLSSGTRNLGSWAVHGNLYIDNGRCRIPFDGNVICSLTPDHARYNISTYRVRCRVIRRFVYQPLIQARNHHATTPAGSRCTTHVEFAFRLARNTIGKRRSYIWGTLSICMYVYTLFSFGINFRRM